MSCCASPRPLFARSGRTFCGNCRRFLDAAPEPLSAEEAGESTFDAAAEEEPVSVDEADDDEEA